MDSFNYYTTLADVWGLYSGNVDATAWIAGGGGRFGGNCLHTEEVTGVSDGTAFYTRAGLASSATYIAGFAFKLESSSLNVNCLSSIFLFLEGSTPHVDVRLNTSLIPYVTRAGTTLATALNAIALDIWHFFEIKVVIDSSAGSVELRIDGTTVCSASGVNTKNGGSGLINAVGIGHGSTNGNSSFGRGGVRNDFCDLYVCTGDSLGACNFLGDCRVECLLPTGAGAETQWAPLSGANYTNVNDNPPNGDTSYNKSNTVGQVDTYAMADLASATGVIYGAQYRHYVRKDNAGTRLVAPVARIGGADYAGSDTSLGSAYAYTREIKEKSPATSAAWTISEVNAMEYGIKVTG